MGEGAARARLGIVMPVYNEGANIGATLAELEEKIHTPHRVHIVYDFDEDDTLPVARERLAAGLPIGFIRNPVRGVVSAIKTGLRQAREPYLLVSMADLSDDYRVVDEMVARMDAGADLVCGSRYMRGGRQIGGPLVKGLMSRTAGVSLKLLAGLPTHDVTNSFKLYRRSMLEQLEIESDGGFEIGMELTVKAHLRGYRVEELPSTWRDRAQGTSRFQILRWLPKYLRWYGLALRGRFLG